MHKNFFYLLTDFNTQSTAEIGLYASALGKLIDHELSAPKAVCIPKNTLKIIAQANNLQPKIYSILTETNFQNTASRQNSSLKMRQLIESQRIPKNLADAFLDMYLHYLEESHVLVQNAHQLSKNVTADSVYPEAVLMDSILETWGQLSQHMLDNSNKKADHIHDILFPSALLLIQQQQTHVSGVAYSFDTRTGAKNRYTIQSMWGIFTPTQPSDSFFIDTNTNQVVYADTAHKQTYLQRLGGIKTAFQTSAEQQDLPSLTKSQAASISNAVQTLKRQCLEHILVEWSIQQDGSLTIMKYEPIEIAQGNVQDKAFEPKSTIVTKKLFVSVQNKQELAKIAEIADGACVYNTGQLLSVTGSHPLHLVKTKQKKHLVTAISRVLRQYGEVNSFPLLYRSNQLTSAELGKLQHSANYEPIETNPYLGLRGGQKLVEQPQLMELELAILQELSADNAQQLGYMLSFVRSHTECAHLVQRISRTGILSSKKIQLWLEIDTPENILSILTYPLDAFAGISINVSALHTFLIGADVQNTNVAGRYPQNTELITRLIHAAVDDIYHFFRHTDIHSRPSIMVDLTHFDHQLFTQLCAERVDGFIVTPEVTGFAREQLLLNQKDQLSKQVHTRVS